MKLLKIASSQLGTKEISGTEHNATIVKYAKESGISGIETDEIPWCSTFINWCAKKAGLPMSGKAYARSWVHVGGETKDPKTGDIVVFWRESPTSWKGHVAIFLGFTQKGDQVICLGGNQKDMVSIAEYDSFKVLTFRRLESPELASIPTSVLRSGSKGQQVMQLQSLLNHLGYDCGDVDGHFGAKTKNAIELLQANQRLTVDGVYNKKVRNSLESLLQS